MYKVYFEDRFILISSEPDRLQKYRLFHKFGATKELYKIISDFQTDSSICSLNIYGTNIKHVWKLFRIYFSETNAAGGLVRHTSGRYLFIVKRDRLDLPKGHIDPGEEPEICAIREVNEECGISGHTIIKSLEPTYHIYARLGISYLKKTNWFLMDFKGSMLVKPQTDEGITGIEWMLPEEICRVKSRLWLSLTDMVNTVVLKELH